MPELKKEPENQCEVKKKCGGCRYAGLSYGEQLKKKQHMINGLLHEFAKPEKIIGMEDPLYYRNKVHHAFGRDRKNNIIHGTYEPSTHRIIPFAECLLEDRICQEIIQTVAELCRSFKIRIYDERNGTGLLRHVLLRRGFQSGEVMCVLVLASPVFPSKNNFVKVLTQKHPEITTVVFNINDEHTSMVLGKRNITVYGPGFISDTLCGLSFRISPDSFYQVNPVQTEVLYQKAIEFAGLCGTETVVDAYCGIGTIGLCASKKAGKVLGIELNRNAVTDARQNAKENHIENVRFLEGDAGEYLEKMAEEGSRANVLLMDPPRTGSTVQFLTAAVKMSPKRIVYVSCGPDTLKRDLGFLTKNGYKVEKIQPVDMFPWTEHIETVVLLSKGEIDSKRIRVEFPLDDMVITAFREKATYPQIKEYVLEQTGLKVSSLYISQIKRKCGLDVGDSYNKPKSEDAKVPQCPHEKEKAIMDALRHFGMIS